MTRRRGRGRGTGKTGSFTTTGCRGRLDAGVEKSGGRGGKIIMKGGTRVARHDRHRRTGAGGGPGVKPLQQMAAAPHGGRQRGGSGSGRARSAPPRHIRCPEQVAPRCRPPPPPPPCDVNASLLERRSAGSVYSTDPVYEEKIASHTRATPAYLGHNSRASEPDTRRATHQPGRHRWASGGHRA